MSRIKIVTKEKALDEVTLTRYENQGLTLIAVNHVKGSRLIDDGSGWEEYENTTSWVYHFRVAGEKMHGERGRTGTFM